MATHFSPRSDLLLLDLDVTEDRTESGIFLGGSSRYATGVVTDKGPDAKLKAECRVVFDRSNLIEIEVLGQKFNLVRESNVLGTTVTITG